MHQSVCLVSRTLMQVHHDPTKILVLGRSGMGKTTYVIKYVKHRPQTTAIIFDHKLEFYGREKIEPIYNRKQMTEAIIRKQPIVSFSHLEEFPGDAQGAFEWICEWSYEVARATQSNYLFVCDEVNRFTGNVGDDWEFNQLIEDGRLWGLDFIGTSHSGNQVHNRLRGQLTEIVAFNTDESLPLQFLAGNGFDPYEVQSLDKGEFLLKSRNLGKFVRGRIFSIDKGEKEQEVDAITEVKPEENTNEINPNGGSDSDSGGGSSSNAPSTIPESS